VRSVDSIRMPWQPVLAGLLLFVIAVVANACGGDSNADESTTNSETLPDQITATVTNDGVVLDQEELLTPASYSLTVRNDSSSSCAFAFDAFVSTIDLAPGESRTVSFETTDANEQVPIGCGDDREATVPVRLAGD
jgi:hypothetical protein